MVSNVAARTRWVDAESRKVFDVFTGEVSPVLAQPRQQRHIRRLQNHVPQ